MAEVKATQGAVDHATELGVDLSQVQPSRPDGVVTKADVADHAKSLAQQVATGPYFYCMEENHPGAPAFQTQPLSANRIFQSSEDVPVCPACGKQTNAIPAAGPDIPPEFIEDLQKRFGR